MSYKKSYINFNNSNGRTIINNFHEADPYHIRKYGGIVNIDGKDVLLEYEGMFRSEAIEHFKQEAKYHKGKFKQLVNFPKVRG